ncbi:hypothetical protein [Alkalicoccobacillus gibsonii]|uniref:hypothetical protein n=1 Tax=Alkalicoccobacillus gibsonii TaxID=79881 RepID=UPI0035121250
MLEELAEWWSSRYGEFNLEDERSIVIVENLKYVPRKGPSEGKWYLLPYSFLKDFEFEEISSNVDNSQSSYIYRIKGTYKGDVEHDFGKFKTYSVELDHLINENIVEVNESFKPIHLNEILKKKKQNNNAENNKRKDD